MLILCKLTEAFFEELQIHLTNILILIITDGEDEFEKSKPEYDERDPEKYSGSDDSDSDIPQKKIEKIERLDLSMADVQTPKDYLLASACRNGSVRIWRAGTDGRLELELPKHRKFISARKVRDKRQNWIALCWPQPTLLICSSIWHEVLMWELIPSAENLHNGFMENHLIHADHDKQIFSIAMQYKIFANVSDEDWRQSAHCVWTSSIDRWLLRTNLESRLNESRYATYGGSITSLASSLLDPHKFAFACGDGTIRVWDFSKPHIQQINMRIYSEKIHRKAVCMDWHPTKDLILTFGKTFKFLL